MTIADTISGTDIALPPAIALTFFVLVVSIRNPFCCFFEIYNTVSNLIGKTDATVDLTLGGDVSRDIWLSCCNGLTDPIEFTRCIRPAAMLGNPVNDTDGRRSFFANSLFDRAREPGIVHSPRVALDIRRSVLAAVSQKTEHSISGWAIEGHLPHRLHRLQA
jgi:hypothetical protein